MAIFFSPDPSHADIKALMDESERDYWDTQKGTPEEREQFWKSLEYLWRSVPDPTEAQLQQVMGDVNWEHCQRGENREDILNFHRRKWKKDHKAAAIARRAEESEPQAKQSPEQIERERKGAAEQQDTTTIVHLGRASSEIREDGHSNAEVAEYFERRYSPRNVNQQPPPAKNSLGRWVGKHPKITFWSGLAMAGSGLGVELSSAPKLAGLLYFISWAIWGLVIYFSPLWKRQRMLSSVLVIGSGMCLGGFWWALLPDRQPTPEEYAEAVWKYAPRPVAPQSPSSTPTPSLPDSTPEQHRAIVSDDKGVAIRVGTETLYPQTRIEYDSLADVYLLVVYINRTNLTAEVCMRLLGYYPRLKAEMLKGISRGFELYPDMQMKGVAGLVINYKGIMTKEQLNQIERHAKRLKIGLSLEGRS